MKHATSTANGESSESGIGRTRKPGKAQPQTFKTYSFTRCVAQGWYGAGLWPFLSLLGDQSANGANHTSVGQRPTKRSPPHHLTQFKGGRPGLLQQSFREFRAAVSQNVTIDGRLCDCSIVFFCKDSVPHANPIVRRGRRSRPRYFPARRRRDFWSTGASTVSLRVRQLWFRLRRAGKYAP